MSLPPLLTDKLTEYCFSYLVNHNVRAMPHLGGQLVDARRVQGSSGASEEPGKVWGHMPGDGFIRENSIYRVRPLQKDV